MSTPTQRVVLAARARGVTVLTHRQWGSKETALYATRRRLTAEGKWPGFDLRVDTVAHHITVTFDDGKLIGDFKADMQEIERIGKERFGTGWSYNWGLDMATGMVGVGQPLDSKGAHTINDKGVKGYSKDQNLKARAIASLGMPGDKFTIEAETSTVRLLVAHIETGYVNPGFDYKPHSFFAAKDCPCDPTRDRMDEIYSKVQYILKKEKIR